MGGYKANDASVPEDGCNEITIMCLKASRRLPLNAPCLSLRMHKNMRQEVNLTFVVSCSSYVEKLYLFIYLFIYLFHDRVYFEKEKSFILSFVQE